MRERIGRLGIGGLIGAMVLMGFMFQWHIFFDALANLLSVARWFIELFR